MFDSEESSRTLGIGIVGLGVSEGWASSAHVPAIAAVPGVELRAVSASSPESARAAGKRYGVRGHAGVADLAADDDVDLIVIAVKVPLHRELIMPALHLGRPVFSEWPLAVNIGEARELDAAGAAHRTFIGLQGRSSPTFRWLRDLIEQCYVGEVLSATVIAASSQWGGPIPDRFDYFLDRSNGATMLSIPFAHNLDLVTMLLGDLESLTATTALRRSQVPVGNGGRMAPMTAHDQIAVTGIFRRGAVLSMHHRGGVRGGNDFTLVIDGTDGRLEVTAPSGYPQMGPVSVRGAQGDAPLEVLVEPAMYDLFPQLVGTRAHVVAHEYAMVRDDLLKATTIAPDFGDALRHHELLDAVNRSATSGTRVSL